MVSTLPPVDRSSLYYNCTLTVKDAPGGHVSVALDANIRNLARTMFLSMGVTPSGDLQLVHVWTGPSGSGAAAGTPTFDLLYYFAMPEHTFPHVSHFSAYCGWAAANGSGDGGGHGGHGGGHGHGPVGHPSAAAGSPLTRALQTLPDMGAVTVGMRRPVQLEARIGPEGARIDHHKGDIVPGSPQRGRGSGGSGSGGRAGAPALAIGLAVVAAGGLALCGGVLYIVHRRRQGEAEGGDSGDDDDSDLDARGEAGGGERRRRGGGGRGGGASGGSDAGSWPDHGWTGPSFSLEYPADCKAMAPPKGSRSVL